MTNQIVFDSKKNPRGEMISLACGHISQNEISFIHEKITVDVEARTGEVAFRDAEGRVCSLKVAPPSLGDEKFSEVKCAVEDGEIKIAFPQYTYKDNYPHCDGESDRWEKSIVGYRFVCYDLHTGCIVE